jgi:hypothetical protein
MRTVAIIGVFTLGGLGLAVDACGASQQTCSGGPEKSAVMVAPLDGTTNQPLCTATVTVTLVCDGGGACGVPMTIGPNGNCSYPGGMSGGTLMIGVTAPGYTPATQQVVVDIGSCNIPKTQNVNITLNPMH